MAISAPLITAAVTAGSAVSQHRDAKKAREEAERQAAEQREALAALESEPEVAMPTGDDEATRRARRRSISAQLRRRGRQSTILTGDDSSGTALGA